MARPLFLLRTFNDVDHITPVIWKALKEGDSAMVVFVGEHDCESDYRLQFLKRDFSIPIYKYPLAYKLTKKKQKVFKVIREIVFNDISCGHFLKKHKITSCVFEWNNGYGRCLRGHFFSVAKKMGIPTFAIPHGCNIYMHHVQIDRTERKDSGFTEVQNVYDKQLKKTLVNCPGLSERRDSDFAVVRNVYGKQVKNIRTNIPDHSERNNFDFYVVQSNFDKQQHIAMGLNPDKTLVVWGSARFYPEWARENLRICPAFKPSNSDNEKVKVVFMLHHWKYNVDQRSFLELVEKLMSCEWVYLVIKDSTRGEGGLPDELRNRYNSLPNVEASVPAHSPALIKWSDVVINFASSIGLEALLQGKQLIHPFYLHGNVTIYDKTEAAHLAKNHEVVIGLLQKLKDGKLPPVSEESKKKLYREVIYGGRDEFDVLGYYWRKITLRE